MVLTPAGRDESVGYEVVRLDTVPLERVATLWRLSLGESIVPRHLAFWKWKHLDNPFGPSPGLAAVAGDRIVALRVFLRWTWVSGARAYHAVRAVDTATHPEWQRRGLFRKLTLELVREMNREGASFVFNTPNAKSRPGYLRMGWQDVGRLPLLVKILKPSRVGSALWRRRTSEVPVELDPDVLGTVDQLLLVPSLSSFLERVWSEEKRLHTPRTIPYLRWRYGAVPGLAYRALWEIEGNRGTFLVVRPRPRGPLRELTLSEFETTRDKDAIPRARRLVAQLVRSSEADYLAACAPRGSAEHQVLRRAGFLPVRFVGPRLTVRLLDAASDEIEPRAWANWRLTIGDLELF